MAPPQGLAATGQSNLGLLLSALVGEDRAVWALETLSVDPALLEPADQPTRAHVAMALNAALFLDLLDRVPTAARHVGEVRGAGVPIVFDHGALRTIDGATGDLPSGHQAFARFLEPLGYEVAGLYPLPALKMTGRAFAHRDLPESVPQFFVSELHIDQLPEEAQAAAQRIFGASGDPFSPGDVFALNALARDGTCSTEQAVTILRAALGAFQRQHPVPALADYRALLEHSKEGAWIATEGNAFNHATTRVPDVMALSDQLKAQGYPMKPAVEVSQNGRVRQTAILADKVSRPFRLEDGSETMLEVPGSFYEFITRDVVPETGKLDLTFDSGNATGIFAVTRDK